jgi:hypothetical protein
MTAKLSQEKVAERIEQLRQRNILLVSPYTKTHDRHIFKCLLDGHEWRTTFKDIFHQKNGCPKCAGKVIDLDKCIQILLDKNIKLNEPYKNNTHIKYKFVCLVNDCGFEWQASFKDVLNKSKSCPRCSGKRYSNTDILIKLNYLEVNRNIKLVSEFTRVSYKHKFKCLLNNCGYEWEAKFSEVCKETGCPKCAFRQLSDEERLKSVARKIIKRRLSDLFYKGVTKTKVHYDDEIMKELIPYWLNEFKLIPSKPNNFIQWHLDHIIPLSWFNPYDINELKLCWSHRNFQWLKASENSSKNNRIRLQDLDILTEWHYYAISQASYAKPLPTSSVSILT